MSTPLGLIVFLLGLASVAHGASTVDVLAFESEQQQRRYKALIDAVSYTHLTLPTI